VASPQGEANAGRFLMYCIITICSVECCWDYRKSTEKIFLEERCRECQPE